MKIVKRLYRLLPWSVKDKIAFFRKFRRIPNLKSPVTLNEKILYRKRHACVTDANYPVLADKYKVREYVSNLIGGKYLIPLYAHFDSVSGLRSEIYKYSDFVIKTNHGAGMVKVIDEIKSEKDVEEIIEDVSRWMQIDFHDVMGEFHYSGIEKLILIEKRIGNVGEFLVDYKVHLFRDTAGGYSYVLQIINDRFLGDLNRTFYIDNLFSRYSGSHELNAVERIRVDEAINLSKVLMGDLEYARVDWYIFDEKLFFGEITLTPAAGLGDGYGDELDFLMGGKWDLSLSPR